jgi:hypothetical protein
MGETRSVRSGDPSSSAVGRRRAVRIAGVHHRRHVAGFGDVPHPRLVFVIDGHQRDAQGGGERLGGRPATLSIAFEGPHHDLVDDGRQARPRRARWRLHGCRARRVPSEQVVGQRAQAVHVGADVEPAAEPRLLGRHVARGADRHRERPRGVRERFGEPQVGDE